MSSIMTNTAAMTALQSLQATQKALNQTQNQISTGYKVATASDNAAYWSIATTMRSDNKALSTVNDALGLGAATVDVAYTAMSTTKDTLDSIKSDLVSATQPGVDKSKIQSDITQLQNQLKSIANSASFSGQNWLSVNSSLSSYKSDQQVVASFNRNADNSISIGTIDVSLVGISLYDANTTTGAGLLDQGQALASVGGLDATATDTAAVDGTSGDAKTFGAFPASPGMTMGDNDAITFDIAVDGGEAQSVSITRATVDTALGTSNGVIGTDADFVKVVSQALRDANVSGATVSDNAGSLEITSNSTVAATSDITVSNVKSSDNGNVFSVGSIDISNASSAQLSEYINGVSSMLQKVTTAASNLGAVKSRIDTQQSFVKSLMDSIDSGVGALVDADMTQASTKLQALQTQQQLGIQALSIANSNAQSILSLFR